MRPGLQWILMHAGGGHLRGGAVLVHTLDRLTRSVRDLGELLELFSRHEVALISVTESLDTGTAGGRMVMNIMATVSQWERETIAERTKAALGALRRHGRVYGRVPYGWRRRGKHLIPDEGEAAIAVEIRHRRSSGGAFHAIAAELNRRGIRTRSGGVWYASTVRSISGSPEVG